MAGGAGRRAAAQIAKEAVKGSAIGLALGIIFKVSDDFLPLLVNAELNLFTQVAVADPQKRTINEYYKNLDAKK